MAQGNLSACLPVTLAYEGGAKLSLVRSDTGNWTGGRVGSGVLKGTKYGIAASAHPTLDIAGLTLADAEAIYDREYFTPAGCAALPAGLDLSHFDGTVNSGLGHSKAWLAKAERASGNVPATTFGYASADTSTSIHAYAVARLASMHAFRTWATFGKGWSARVAGVEAKSLTMALGSAAPAAIAAAGVKAATKAKAASVTAHASAVITTGATIEAVHAHPVIGGGVALLSLMTWVWSAFHASTSGARAATLAAHVGA